MLIFDLAKIITKYLHINHVVKLYLAFRCPLPYVLLGKYSLTFNKYCTCCNKKFLGSKYKLCNLCERIVCDNCYDYCYSHIDKYKGCQNIICDHCVNKAIELETLDGEQFLCGECDISLFRECLKKK